MSTVSAAQTRVVHRDLRASYPLLVRGEGVYLFDDQGNRYLDGSGGSAAVTAIGHGVAEVVAAIADQARRLACAPTHAFATEPTEALGRLIIERFAPPAFAGGKVWFVSGGSEAVESAVKTWCAGRRPPCHPRRSFPVPASPSLRTGCEANIRTSSGSSTGSDLLLTR